MNLGRAVGNFAGSVTLAVRGLLKQPFRTHPSGQLLMRLGGDQRRIWSSPRAILRGEGWKAALSVAGATVALIALDPWNAPYLQRTGYQGIPAVRWLNNILSGRNMALLINGVPLGFFIAGLITRRPYTWRTGLMAAEAAADTEIIAFAIKRTNHRTRPIGMGLDADYRRTWFLKGGVGCFPSAHTASAFSVATVIAERYPEKRFAKWLAYTLAGVVGGSRLNTRAHYPSDVFFGGVLGYSISHFVVMQRPKEPHESELTNT